MYQQTLKMGLGDKLIIGVMTVILFVTGFFASLLALAIGGATSLFVLAKIRWVRRRTEKACLDGEYQVVRECHRQDSLTKP